uniref:Uncharacterized protein n=1 Tax=Anguilla anguilla TaxID=7936 RepID=A0A0E9TV30_ANGAN
MSQISCQPPLSFQKQCNKDKSTLIFLLKQTDG